MAGVKKIHGTTPIWPTKKDQRQTPENARDESQKKEQQDTEENVTDKEEGSSKLPPEGQGGNIDEFV